MTYKSSFGPCIEEMLLVRHRSGYQLKFMGFFLHDFDEFCAYRFPDAELLTREIGEQWIHSSDSTSHAHMARRVQTIRHIGTYQQSLGMNAYVPDYSIRIPKAEEPHLFTDEQLALFFQTLDNELQPTEVFPYKDIIYPVFFRLVYTCGLRSCEACNLRVDDVDLEKGSIAIYQSKGYKDRELMLSDDIKELCRKFDSYYRTVLPDRKYFFQPSADRERLTSDATSKVFDAVLKKAKLDRVPGKKFTQHGLRHLFAVQNIRKCAELGEDFYNWIQYLCRYMGHKHIRYTLYYLHITSQLFPIYEEKLCELTEGIGVIYAED